MAHFAEIDPASNIVLRVLVVSDENENRGQEFLADDLGLGGTWIQTSYNTHGGVHREQVQQYRDPVGDEEGPQDAGTLMVPDGGTPLRYNYASTGDTYDADADAFSGPQPYPSWSLDENYIWQPPTPFPHDAPTPTGGNTYDWDEDTTSWVEAE